jgi:uncharacterized membrane protein HdeD (DUF308 family)
MTEPANRKMSPVVTLGLALLGVLLIVIAIVYLTEPAKSLPSFFPGHASGSSHHHSKHGILALILGLISLAGAWMTTGRQSV